VPTSVRTFFAILASRCPPPDVLANLDHERASEGLDKKD
jgi:hypothetical protein